jgi:peptidoglycan/LPS O-acetylase OafA/YrhL
MRGLAVLVVLLYHFGAAIGSGGYLGVDTFFVISGFVITRSLRRSDAQARSRLEFFLRRAARLLPNLIVFLLVVFVWDSFKEHRVVTAQNAAVLEGLTQTYNLFASPGIATRHLWSLSMEWQFYLFLPLVLPFLVRGGVPVAARRAALIALASLALRPVLIYSMHATYLHAYLWPITRIDGLMLGVSVAMLYESGTRLNKRWVQFGAMAGLLALMLFSPRWIESPAVSLQATMPLTSLFTALIVWTVASAATAPSIHRLLSWAPLRYVGDRSYSIYLWHYFIGVGLLNGSEGFAGPRFIFVQFAASLLVAFVMYEVIEQPARVYLNRLIALHFREPSGVVLPSSPTPA